MHTQNQRFKYLLTDYSSSSDLLRNYSNMRISAVGVAFALYGAIISIPTYNSPYRLVIMSLTISLISLCSIRIIGSINANVYARCLHLEWVEKQLGEIGFFSYWNSYVIDNMKDSASASYVLAAHALNIGMIAYVVICALNCFDALQEMVDFCASERERLLYGIPIVTAVIGMMIFIKNIFFIKSNMIASTLIPRLRKLLESKRVSVVMMEID